MILILHLCISHATTFTKCLDTLMLATFYIYVILKGLTSICFFYIHHTVTIGYIIYLVCIDVLYIRCIIL